jgi:hypothetical protein
MLVHLPRRLVAALVASALLQGILAAAVAACSNGNGFPP